MQEETDPILDQLDYYSSESGGLDILHGKTCYNRLICIYL